MLSPNLSEWDFTNLEYLLNHRIPESNILDYKEQLISLQDIVKQICGFANSNGGYLIFGVEESNTEPSYPVSIEGIDSDTFDTQQIEQMLNAAIHPRTSFQINSVRNPNNGNYFLVIYVPPGDHQPYYSSSTDRYYKRYERETRPMTESEISAMYFFRFSTKNDIEKYIDQTIQHHHRISPVTVESGRFPGGFRPVVYCHIILAPLNINDRIYDPSDNTQLDMQGFRYQLTERTGEIEFIPGEKRPSKFGSEWSLRHDGTATERLEVHRNGLIHHVEDFGRPKSQQSYQAPDIRDDQIFVTDYQLAKKMLLALKFSHAVFENLEFAGPVIIRLQLRDISGTRLFVPSDRNLHYIPISKSEEISVERRWNSWQVNSDYALICKSIMDEFSNHFGLAQSFVFLNGTEFASLLNQ